MSAYDDIEQQISQGSSAAASSPYDEIENQIKQNDTSRAAVLVGTSNVAPDRAADNLKLAKSYGVTPAVVDQFPEQFRQDQLTKMAVQTLATSPVLRAHINQTPGLAPVIGDDLRNASAIEQIGAFTQSLPLGLIHGASEGAAQFFKMASMPVAGLAHLVDNAAGTNMADKVFQYATAPMDQAAEANATQPGANFYAKAAHSVGSLASMIMTSMMGAPEQAAGATAEAATKLWPTITGMLEHGTGAMAIPSLTSAVDAGQKVYDSTGDGTAAFKAAKAAYLSNTAMGIPPMSAGGGLIARLLGGFASGVTTGELGRQYANANMPDNMQQPASFEDAMLQGIMGAGFGGFGPRSAPEGWHEAVRQTYTDAAKAQAAQEDFGRLDALGQLASASKWRERDPESFNKFVDDVTTDGKLANVYVDASVFKQEMEKAGTTPEELQQTLPDVAAQMHEAGETEGAVKISTADYATHIAGTPLGEAILPNLRTDPEGMTYNEMQEHYDGETERFSQLAKDISTKAEDASAFQKSEQAVRENLRAQNDATGRYPGAVSKLHTEVSTLINSQIARRLGITPEEAFAQHGAQISDGSQGGAGFDQASSKGLYQNADGPFGPMFTEHYHDAQGAIEKLKQAQTGEAIGALYHPDIGDIDLVWGKEGTGASDGYGLAKLVKYHPEALADLQGILSAMTVTTRSVNRINLESSDHKAGVRLTWNGQEKHWLMTAFRKDGGGGDATRTDTDTISGKDDTASLTDASDDIVDQTIEKFQQQARGYYSPEHRMIAVLKDANLSTYIHETGHYLVDTYAKIASMPDAPAEIKADVAQLLSHVGAPDLEAWNKMSLEEQRPYHEALAESFERYFMEGKAPTLELQPVFSRVKAWMMSIYKHLTAIGEPLTPEVRQVFDRMLGAEQDIKDAENARGYARVLEDKPDGVSDADWKDYINQGESATNQAIDDMQGRSLRDMKWLGNAKSKALKALQREARGVRSEMRIQARKDVLSTPVYQAWSYLTREDEQAHVPDRKPKQNASINTDVDSMFTAIAKLGGIDRESIKSEWGVSHEDVKSEIFGKPVLRKEGGKSLDEMAELLGERGYLPKDESGKVDLHDFEDKFGQEHGGDLQYSDEVDYDKVHPEEPNADMVGDYRAGKINKEILDRLRDTVGEANVERLNKLKMVKSGGIDPELLAEHFGFQSGEEMLKALATSENPHDAVEGRTDQLMLEQHGELSTPDALNDAANVAIHNESRAKFMATGLKLLSNSPIPARMLEKGAKEAAEGAIAGKKVGEINPKVYEAQERRANKSAIRLAPKDTEGAIKAQRAALLNNQLARAARDAKDETAKILTYLKRFNKDSILAKMDVDIRDQLTDVLSRFDLRKNPTDAPTKAQENLAQWIESQKAVGMSPDVSPDLLNPAFRTHYADMTMEQFRGMFDTVKMIEKMGQERRYVTLDGKRLELRDAVDPMIAKMVERGEKFTDAQLAEKPRRGVDPLWRVALDRTQSMLRSAFAEFMPQHFKANRFDLHEILGPFHRALFEPIFAANYHQLDMARDVSRNFRTAAKALGKDWQKSLHDVVSNHKLMDNSLDTPVLRRLTRGDMIGIALHVGNESNFDKLVNGMGWKPEDVWNALHDNMRADDWHAAKTMGEAAGAHWQDMVDMNRRLGNTSPDKIEPRPFKTKFGDMPGWYAPIKYDPIRSKLGRKKADAAIVNPADGLFSKDYFRADTTTNGSLNARASGYHDFIDLNWRRMEEADRKSVV